MMLSCFTYQNKYFGHGKDLVWSIEFIYGAIYWNKTIWGFVELNIHKDKAERRSLYIAGSARTIIEKIWRSLQLLLFKKKKNEQAQLILNKDQILANLSLHPRIRVWFCSTTSLLPFRRESNFSEIASETSPSIIANMSMPPKLMDTETNLGPMPSEFAWFPESATYVQDNQRQSAKLSSVTPNSATPPRQISKSVATNSASGLAYGWTDKKTSTLYASCLLRDTSSVILSVDLLEFEIWSTYLKRINGMDNTTSETNNAVFFKLLLERESMPCVIA